ncbi:hybrid sensor histidine kinase/response regulator [Thauera phenolivorans]|uniref:hybrid sensor histidine kinase/response regulator n=1 Tax=Thauera phenolivorans TaxID=1792543 RepID=UPI000839E884|nr:Hpt domain-containing protein [Thauera phenolivorans]
MTQKIEVDSGPLAWVSGEIDAALARALDVLGSEAAPAAGARPAAAELQQIRGALRVVGLEGPARFAECLAHLLDALATGEPAATADGVALARRAIAALGNYIDEIAHGAPDQPLRLAPLYEQIAAARGKPLPCAAELFFPDLSPRAPARDTALAAPDEATRLVGLRAARAQFERSMLDWLRKPGETSAAGMRDAVARSEALEAAATARTPWWIALGVMDALVAGSLPTAAAKHLCTQLGAHFRRATAGAAQPLPERLLREMLYPLATLPASTAHQRAIRDTWRLDAALAGAGVALSETPLAPLLAGLRARLVSLRARWDAVGQGSAEALPLVHEELQALASAAAELERPALERLLDGLVRFVAWLRQEPQQFSEAAGLELAALLLLVETALERRRPDAGFAARTELALERLTALQRGERIAGTLAEETRAAVQDAQERDALAQLTREILASLGQVEQTLDDHFRHPETSTGLAAVRGPLRQIEGALHLLGDGDALAALHEADAVLEGMAAANPPLEADYERLAAVLAALGFHLEALQRGRRERSILHAVLPQLAAAETVAESAEVPAAVDADAWSEDTADERAEASVGAGAEAPVENPVSDAAQAPIETPAPATVEEAGPGIDAELLEIFTEEADQVLAAMADELAQLQATPADSEAFTTIRRGFHTLKGSGRMVGLDAFGEAAWALEQTLNHWLQRACAPTPALCALIDEARHTFVDWVARLRAGAAEPATPTALIDTATRLRESAGTTAEAPQHAEAASPAEAGDGTIAPLEAIEPAIGDEATVLDLEAALDGVPELALPELERGSADAAADAPTEAFDTLEFRLGDETPLDAPGEALIIDLEASGFTSMHRSDEDAAQAVAAVDADTGESTAAAEAESAAASLAGPEAGEAAAPARPASVQIGDSVISAALHALYTDESGRHLATLEQALASEGTVPAPATVRAAHTLAGISGTAGLPPLHQLGRALEQALERLQALGRAPDADENALLTDATTRLQAMLVEVVGLRMPPAADGLVGDLERCGLAPAAAPAAAIEPAPATPAATPRPGVAPGPSATAQAVRDDIDEQLLPIFREEAAELLAGLHASLRAWQATPAERQHAPAIARLLHTFKGSARMAGAMTLGEQLHQLESRLGAGEPGGEAQLVEELIAGLDAAEQTFETLGRIDDGPATPAVPARAGADIADESDAVGSPTLRLRADLIDRFVNQAGEIGISRTRIEGELRTLRHSLLDLTENVIRLRNQLREVELQADVQMQSRIAHAESSDAGFDPLEMDRYTRLQELTRMMAESVNDVSTVQQTLLHNLDTADITLNAQARMARELQQSLMQVRMLPFDSLADRLYRVVRRSAKELGKRANLDLRGGHIEVDRSVLEQMAAPLEHLLRNALAHGIETPAERLAAGKPETGQIALTVRQQGNEIAIELADDGAGLDLERIASRAREKGLLAAGEAADARRLSSMIFLPGFSTASTVSAVSGRGVGMDVVKAQTAAAGGRIELDSVRGRGLKVGIHLPLTLAVTQALLVRAGGRSYAIPASMVAQVLELKPAGLRELRDEGGTDWQAEHYAYRYLPRLLGDADSQPEIERHNWVLLLRAGSQTLALHVDGLRGIQEIVVKGAGPQLSRIVGMSGATVLGDGEVVLILNPVALAGRLSIAAADAAHASPSRAAAPVQVPTVMVVDDSLTVRKITTRLLEREGYRVVTAKDGVDALEKLVDLTPDVLLSDIEMPRMDGFDLVRNVRADARTRALPVIMITSRLADKHRRHADEIGVDHYLGKPYQEEALLALVARYARPEEEIVLVA